MYIFGESQVYRLKYYKAVQQFVLGVHDQMAYEWIWISVLLVVQPLRPKFASRVKVGPRPGSPVQRYASVEQDSYKRWSDHFCPDFYFLCVLFEHSVLYQPWVAFS